MGAQFSQVFPGEPALTENNLSSQSGRIFVVTGGYSGIGYELSKILYHAGGKVYIAGRNESQGKAAISSIESATPPKSDQQSGSLHFLYLDLSDLSTIKASASAFLSQESTLSVLFNNAGVNPPPGSTSAQGHELTVATNCVGVHLFTILLLPALRASAASSPRGTTRVVWTSSQVVDFGAPKNGLMMPEILDPPKEENKGYYNSKLGNWYLASEFGRRIGATAGILSVTQNPGGIRTGILRSKGWFLRVFLASMLYPAIYGAYTELWCGVSEELKVEEHQGAYIVPWGKVHPSPRGDLLNALKGKEEGGTGQAEEFWEWCEQMVEWYK